jgi:hypothetical protein
MQCLKDFLYCNIKALQRASTCPRQALGMQGYQLVPEAGPWPLARAQLPSCQRGPRALAEPVTDLGAVPGRTLPTAARARTSLG